MSLNLFIKDQLYKLASSGTLSLHAALSFLKLTGLSSNKKRSSSGQMVIDEVIQYLIEATSPNINSVWASVLFPAEILHPFGVRPITMEIITALLANLNVTSKLLDQSESDNIPPTMCSFHRTILGLSKTNFLRQPKFVAATSLMCDGNVKSFSEIARQRKVPFIFLDIPFEENVDSINYATQQLKDIIEKIADILNTSFHPNLLNQTIICANEAIALQKKFYNLSINCHKNIYQHHETVNFTYLMYFLLGTKRLTKIIDARCKDITSGTSYNKFFDEPFCNKNAKKLMWLHIVTQYKTPLWGIIDNGKNSKIVCDEYSYPYFDEYDLASPLESIAKRLIRHTANGAISRRIENILKIAKDFNVDGVIHYSSWGCHQASGNIHLISKAIESAGYNFIDLNGDAVDQRNSSFEQHKVRLEAFLESMNAGHS